MSNFTTGRLLQKKSSGQIETSLRLFVSSLVVLLLSTDMAFAQGVQSLGDIMCSVSRNLAPFEKLFVGLAYITGAGMIGVGLSQMAFFVDVFATNKQYGISRPKGLLIAGAALLALPAFLRFCVNTLFNYSYSADFGGGLSACLAYIGYGGTRTGHGLGGDTGLDGLMINLIYNIKSPMIFMLSVISILMGIFLVFRGLVKGANFGKDGKSSIPAIVSNLTVGTILYTVGTSVNTIMDTVFGTSAVEGSANLMSSIAFDFGANTQPFQQAVYAALTFFQLVGCIAFIRGWLIIKDAVEGSGGSDKTVPRGLTHIIGGVLAINIYRFLEVMDTSFGTNFIS